MIRIQTTKINYFVTFKNQNKLIFHFIKTKITNNKIQEANNQIKVHCFRLYLLFLESLMVLNISIIHTRIQIQAAPTKKAMSNRVTIQTSIIYKLPPFQPSIIFYFISTIQPFCHSCSWIEYIFYYTRDNCVNS